MQQYFVNYDDDVNEFLIDGADYHHIIRVMRMGLGDEIACVSLNKKRALCKIIEKSTDYVKVSVLKWDDVQTELAAEVTIVSGIPKGDKLDLVVQKGTELGAAKFVPFEAARSISKWDKKKSKKRLERLGKIAKEAAEQSGRLAIPDITSEVNLNELIKMSEAYDYKIVAYEEEAKQKSNKSALADLLGKVSDGERVIVVFGPEGGLTEEEVAALRNKGFTPCSLGPRILRTETAPLYFLAAVSYELEMRA